MRPQDPQGRAAKRRRQPHSIHPPWGMPRLRPPAVGLLCYCLLLISLHAWQPPPLARRGHAARCFIHPCTHTRRRQHGRPHCPPPSCPRLSSVLPTTLSFIKANMPPLQLSDTSEPMPLCSVSRQFILALPQTVHHVRLPDGSVAGPVCRLPPEPWMPLFFSQASHTQALTCA